MLGRFKIFLKFFDECLLCFEGFFIFLGVSLELLCAHVLELFSLGLELCLHLREDLHLALLFRIVLFLIDFLLQSLDRRVLSQQGHDLSLLQGLHFSLHRLNLGLLLA